MDRTEVLTHEKVVKLLQELSDSESDSEINKKKKSTDKDRDETS